VPIDICAVRYVAPLGLIVRSPVELERVLRENGPRELQSLCGKRRGFDSSPSRLPREYEGPRHIVTVDRMIHGQAARSESQRTEVATARAWELESTPCVTAGGLMTACTTLLEVSKVSTDETRMQAGFGPLIVMARLMAGRITCRPPVPPVEEYGVENEKLCPLVTEKPVCAKGRTLFGL
jgi:hypothetical protein